MVGVVSAALIATSVLGSAAIGTEDVYATSSVDTKSTIVTGAGKANDGVDFGTNGLSAAGNYIYYGTYKHVTAVTKTGSEDSYDISYKVAAREETASPILWRVAGEEDKGNGNGDGDITAISQYVLDIKSFRKADAALEADIAKEISGAGILADYAKGKAVPTPAHTESKQYAGSNIQTFLNGTFLKSFSAAEKAVIPSVTVKTKTYRLGEKNSKGLERAVASTNHGRRFFAKTDTVFTSGDSTITKQKVYIPWITSTDDENNYASADEFNWDYQESVFYSANGKISSNEAVNLNNAIIRRTGAFEPSTLKGGTESLAWITRSPCPGYHAYGNLAEFGGDLGYNSANSLANNGVKPVTKFDAASVVFASEISAKAANGKTKANSYYKVPADNSVKAYKLTILTKDGKVKLGSVKSGKKALKGTGKEKLTVKAGKKLTLKGTVSGANKIVYKIVQKSGNKRQIVSYGTGTKKSIKVAAKKNYNVSKSSNLKKGSYTLYIWAQKDAAKNSNIASRVKIFKLSVK
jgi:hypothetical protein